MSIAQYRNQHNLSKIISLEIYTAWLFFLLIIRGHKRKMLMILSLNVRAGRFGKYFTYSTVNEALSRRTPESAHFSKR